MANLQRVESAEAAVEIKMNLRAELARRQEGVDAVKAAKGSGIRKFWKTTAPLGIESVPGFKDSTRVRHCSRSLGWRAPLNAHIPCELLRMDWRAHVSHCRRRQCTRRMTCTRPARASWWKP